jgi:hypothetical protein
MYQVGDIVYIISNKRRQVLPAQIVEQVNRRTLAGEQIQYRALVAGSDRAVDVDSLSDLGNLHLSLQAVHDSLREQSLEAIRTVIDQAAAMASEHFGTGTDEKLPGSEEVPLQDEEPVAGPTPGARKRRVKVKLPDGSSANVSVDDVL